MHWFAAPLRFCPHQQVMTPIQQMWQRMAGVHGQRRQHRKNLLLKITVRPRRAFRRQVRDFSHVNPILAQFRQQFIIPKRILRSHELADCFLDAIKRFRRT